MAGVHLNFGSALAWSDKLYIAGGNITDWAAAAFLWYTLRDGFPG